MQKSCALEQQLIKRDQAQKQAHGKQIHSVLGVVDDNMKNFKNTRLPTRWRMTEAGKIFADFEKKPAPCLEKRAFDCLFYRQRNGGILRALN